MAKKFLVAYILCALSVASAVAKSAVYHYDPEKVELRGKIEMQSFAGRPGYESVKNGDEIERGWYLKLNQPIDVEVRKDTVDPNASSEKDVKVLQLAINYRTVAKNELAVGKEVLVSGHLFHAFTGHHHARVLLSVDRIKGAN